MVSFHYIIILLHFEGQYNRYFYKVKLSYKMSKSLENLCL